MGNNLAPRGKDKMGEIVLRCESAREQLEGVIPAHKDVDTFIRLAISAVARTPKLLECTSGSILRCLIVAARLGLEPDGILGSAYMVPFGKEAVLIPGYRGLIDLARRSGHVEKIEARVVHEHDTFEIEYGLVHKLKHVPFSGDGGALKAVYAVAHLVGGSVQIDCMWRHDIERIRKRSRAGESGPWKTDFAEMAKKTVVRRLCKMLPLSVELAAAALLQAGAEAGQVHMGEAAGALNLAMASDLALPAPKPESQADALAEKIGGEQKQGWPEDIAPLVDEDREARKSKGRARTREILEKAVETHNAHVDVEAAKEPDKIDVGLDAVPGLGEAIREPSTESAEVTEKDVLGSWRGRKSGDKAQAEAFLRKWIGFGRSVSGLVDYLQHNFEAHNLAGITEHEFVDARGDLMDAIDASIARKAKEESAATT